MTVKTILIVAAVVLILVVAGGLYFWNMMQEPLYKPGMVREGKGLGAPLTPPTQPSEAGTWLVEEGIRLHYFADGQGRPVLFVHGGPGAPATEPLDGLHLLADRYQFLYYDQRGCGASTRPIDRFASSNMWENMQKLDKTLGLGTQIADIERIRRIIGEEKLILIGHSWGGFMASLYAAEFPEHVEALILSAPANMLVMPQPEADSDLFTSVRDSLPEGQRPEFEAFMKEYFDFGMLFQKSDADLVAMNERFGEYYIQVVEVGDIESSSEQGQSGGWMVWGMYMSMGQRHDYRGTLKTVDAPVLVIHGADDLQSEAASRQYADLFPNAEFVVIQDASHFSFNQQPEQFAQIVGEFLAGLP